METKTFTLEEGKALLETWESSQHLFERPWLDDLAIQLRTLALNASWGAEDLLETWNRPNIQGILRKLDQTPEAAQPAKFPRKTPKGKSSKRWSTASREKTYGKGPNQD